MYKEMFIYTTLFAIDEAHCLVTWGHNFRMSYSSLNMLRKVSPEVPVMALSATSTRFVTDELNSSLQMRKPIIFKSPYISCSIHFFHIYNLLIYYILNMYSCTLNDYSLTFLDI